MAADEKPSRRVTVRLELTAHPDGSVTCCAYSPTPISIEGVPDEPLISIGQGTTRRVLDAVAIEGVRAALLSLDAKVR